MFLIKIPKTLIRKLKFKIHQGKTPHKLPFFLLNFIFFILSILNRKRKKYKKDSLIICKIKQNMPISFELINQKDDVFFLKDDFLIQEDDIYELKEVLSSEYSYYSNNYSLNREINLLFKRNYCKFINFYLNLSEDKLTEQVCRKIKEFYGSKKEIHFFLPQEKIFDKEIFITPFFKVATSVEEKITIALRCDFYCGPLDEVGKEILQCDVPALYNCSLDFEQPKQLSQKVFQDDLKKIDDKCLENLLFPLLEQINLS